MRLAALFRRCSYDLLVRDAESKRAWGASHAVLLSVLRDLRPRIGVEVGVAFGGNAESILDGTEIETLYLVDPYQHRFGYRDPMNWPQAEFDRLHAYVTGKLARFGDRATMIRKVSLAAACTVPRPVDFVFIDAEHTYEAVRADILAWLPALRPGGLLAGHDYRHPSFPGVATAVHSVFDPFAWPVRDHGEHVWSVVCRGLTNRAQFIPLTPAPSAPQ